MNQKGDGTRRLCALAGVLLLPTSLCADAYYWAGAADFNVGNLNNWSTDKNVLTVPATLPGGDDVVVWGYNTVARSMYLDSDLDILAYKLEATTSSTWPWIDSGGNDVYLSGTTIGGVANAVVYSERPGSINKDQVILKGGGEKVIYHTSGSQFEINSGVSESGGSASLVLDGGGRVRINGSFSLTGDITITSGNLRVNEGFDISGLGGVLTIGAGGRLNVQTTGLSYVVSGLVVDGTSYGPGVYGPDELGYAFLEANGGGNVANSLITVVPEPSSITLVGVFGGLLLTLARRRPA